VVEQAPDHWSSDMPDWVFIAWTVALVLAIQAYRATPDPFKLAKARPAPSTNAVEPVRTADEREEAALLVLASGAPDGPRLYRQVGLDPTLPAEVRDRIITRLEARGADVVDLLEAAATNDDNVIRQVAACVRLIKLGDSTGADVLLALVVESPPGRTTAFEALVSQFAELPSEYRDRVLALLGASSLDLAARIRAAVALAAHPVASQFVIASVGLDEVRPDSLAIAVRHLCTVYSSDDLIRLVRRLEPTRQRLVARTIASEADQPNALAAARALLADTALEPGLRRSVAAVLAWVHEPGGVEYLVALASDGEEHDRVFARRTLADADVPGFD
jgi:hypothetical protein